MLGAVKLTKNADFDHYKYSGFVVGFDRRETFSVPCGFGRNDIIFDVDINLSPHFDNKGEDIFIFGEGPTQRVDNTTLAVE